MKVKADKKIEPTSLLRTPKAKNTLGLKIPTIAMPHEDLIQPEKPRIETIPVSSQATYSTLTGQSSLTGQAKLSGQPEQTTQSSQTTHTMLSGEDERRSTSAFSVAGYENLFIGKSRQLYETLYGLTHGAAIPERKVRISKIKLMEQSGIGSRVTFDSCVERLVSAGLLKLVVFSGEHQGNEFEILLPEELYSVPSLSSQPGHTTIGSIKSEAAVSSVGGLSSLPSIARNKFIAEKPMMADTNLENTVETVFGEMCREFSERYERLTGNLPEFNQAENWRELAELLMSELEAAAQNRTISNVPAFLIEYLRGKLAAKKTSQ